MPVVRSHPSSLQRQHPSLDTNKDLKVVLVNTTWSGSKTLSAVDDTIAVICFLSSLPCIQTCFEPYFSHVLAPPIGTR